MGKTSPRHLTDASAAPDSGEPQFAFAGFDVFDKLGSGTFADTYRAHKNGQWFALKIQRNPPGSEAERADIQKELDGLSVGHNNLMSCLEHGEGHLHDGRGPRVPYFAMPYVGGTDLAKHIKLHGPLSVEETIAIARQIAAGLAALHDNQILHRDLKPSNILIAPNGHVWLIDFGLARFQALSTVTEPGQFLGTNEYAAPEQLSGSYDYPIDLYALGVIIFEMVTGERPFEAESMPELVDAIRSTTPDLLEARTPSAPVWLQELVACLLEKEPVLRPSSATEVWEMLDPAGREAARPKRPEYKSDGPLILGVRVPRKEAATAVSEGLAENEREPDYVIGSLGQSHLTRDMVSARGFFQSELPIGVDTKVEMTAVPGFSKIKYLREAGFAPESGEPYRPEDIRVKAVTDRIARQDLKIQDEQGGGLLRAPSFVIEGENQRTLRGCGQLLASATKAHEAIAPGSPLAAVVKLPVEELEYRQRRLEIASHFNRGNPDLFVVEAYDVDHNTLYPQLSNLLEFCLLIQNGIGVPVVVRLPGNLAEVALAVGVGGVEIALTRAGVVNRPTTKSIDYGENPPRFEFGSLMLNLPRDRARKLLGSGAVVESTCLCRACLSAGPEPEGVRWARHELVRWVTCRDEFAAIALEDRYAKFESRLNAAREATREAAKEDRSLRNAPHLKLMKDTLGSMWDRRDRVSRAAIREAA